MSHVGDVTATETGQQSDPTGKPPLVSQLAKVIKNQDGDAMKTLDETMKKISQKV